MINLIKSDLYKLKYNKVIYISIIIIVVLAIISLVDNKMTITSEDFQNLVGGIEDIENNDFGYLVEQVSYTGREFAYGAMGWSGTYFFIIIVVSILASKEFSDQTIRIIVSRGISRVKIYLSKFIVVAVVTTFMCTVSMILLGVLSGIIYGYSVPFTLNEFLNLAKITLGCSFLLIGLSSMCMLVAFVTRNMTWTLVINLVGTQVVELGIGFLAMYFQPMKQLNEYLIMTQVFKLSSVQINGGDLMQAVITGGIYVGVALIVGIISFNRRDIR